MGMDRKVTWIGGSRVGLSYRIVPAWDETSLGVGKVRFDLSYRIGMDCRSDAKWIGSSFRHGSVGRFGTVSTGLVVKIRGGPGTC